MGELGFSYKDLYPSYGGDETSTEAIPDENDMDALNENADDAEHLRTRLPQLTMHAPEGTYLVWVDFRRLGLGGRRSCSRSK